MKKPGWRTRLIHGFFLLKRPMTLGVRAIVTDDAGRVLLVRHSYVTGWHLPGGGVERGETALAALAKELDEETGIEPLGEPQLLAVIANRRASKRDHVLLYRCLEWRRLRAFEPTREILETGFFALDGLPEGVTAPTRTRLEEVFGDGRVSQFW